MPLVLPTVGFVFYMDQKIVFFMLLGRKPGFTVKETMKEKETLSQINFLMC